MNNWDDFKVVLALHRAGTLRGAAALLGVNHSTVSRRLRSLESDAPEPVFEKVVGGYQTTGFGDRYVENAEKIEAIVIASERQGRAQARGVSGEVKLSLPDTLYRYLLMPALVGFAQSHPNLDLIINPSSRLVNLDRSEADVVIRGVKEPSEHLVGRQLFPYALSYYCHVDYLDARAAEHRQWIGSADNQARKKLLSASPFPDAPVGLKIDDVVMRHEAAAAGHGMIIDACYMADPDPRLMRLPDARTFKGPPLWVLTHPDLRETPRIKFVMQFLVEQLRSSRALIEGNANTSGA